MLEAVADWIEANPIIIGGLVAGSLVSLVASAIGLPIIVARIRPDYFNHARRPPSRWADWPAPVRLTLIVLKNLAGAIFMIGGIAMLVLPGQGLLTLLVGFLLVDGPGKYRFETWLVRRPWVRRSIDWLRRRAGRGPLELDGPPATDRTDPAGD